MNEKEFNETSLCLLKEVDFKKAKRITKECPAGTDRHLFHVEFPDNSLVIEELVFSIGRGLTYELNLIEIDGHKVKVPIPESKEIRKRLNDIVYSYDDGKNQKCIDALKNIVNASR